MPRITRAALRSNTVLEEANTAASVPLPSTPLSQRTPLGEIAGNVVEAASTPNVHHQQSQQSRPEKKAPKRKRGKLKRAKKGEQTDVGEEEEHVIDVIEDGNQSTVSSAVNEACQELLKESDGGMKFRCLLGERNPMV